MDYQIVGMMLSAALLHSSWHALVKTSGDRMISLAGMNVISASAAVLALPFVTIPSSGSLWAILAVSVVLHNGYKASLAAVYRLGDLSHAYPIARGISPVASTLFAVIFLAEAPTVPHLVAILLISTGLLTLALGGSQTRPNSRLLGFAALAGLTVAGYSVLDGYGARLNQDWLSFTVWLVLLDGASFVVVTHVCKGAVFWRTLRAEWQRTLISGTLGIASFGIFIWALSRGPIGGVSALRETSVLFASLIGIFILKEPCTTARIGGGALITAGIILFSIKAV